MTEYLACLVKVCDIFEVNILMFVRNCLYGKCPSIFQNYFTYQQHNYPSRQPKLYIHRHRTNLAASILKIKGATLWNNLDTKTKDKAALISFKKILKSHYLSRYWNRCISYSLASWLAHHLFPASFLRQI